MSGSVAAVLAEHQIRVLGRIADTCACGWRGGGHSVHLADVLAPLLAEAWDEGVIAGTKNESGSTVWDHNPYRTEST